MSEAIPNLDTLRAQTDAALSQLIDAGTPDGTTANLIEVLHGLSRRVERLEAMAPQVSAPLPAQSTANPAGDVTTPLQPVEGEAHELSPETPA